MADFLPRRGPELVDWVRNFNTLIQVAPTSIGLTAAQATAFTALYTTFTTAYDIATAGPTRTAGTIQTKDTARDAMIDGPGGVRQLVGIIQKFPGTTDTQRVDLRITVPDATNSPVPAPTLAPEIDVLPAVVRTVRIRLHNEQTLGHRRKPDGVFGATIFSYVGALPPPLDQIDQWKFEMNTGKTTEDITFPSSVPAGGTVWITASWYNRRGEQGPATPPVNANLPGTLQQAA